MAVGVDASADALAYAARLAARERLRNLLLLREPVEGLALVSVADEVTVHFPWGSLLRGALAEDATAFAAICRLPKTGGTLSLLLSVIRRDGREPLGPDDLAHLRRLYDTFGLTLTERRAATRRDIAAVRSSWGKRLDVGGTRPGHMLRFIRGSAPA